MKRRQLLIRIATVLRRAAPAFAVLALVAVSSVPAGAASLDDYRRQGIIGERYDGYVVARQNSAAARNMAAEVNAKRRSVYANRAKQQRVSIGQVGQVYAKEIYAKAPKGTWFLTANNKWVRK